jgi:hypothetical protein
MGVDTYTKIAIVLAALQAVVAILQIAREILGLRRDTQDDDEDTS